MTTKPEEVPVWREEARGAYPDPTIFQLPAGGVEAAIEHGKFPFPPLVHLTGAWFIEGDDDHTVWEQPLTPWFLSSQGVVPGGYLAVVADMAAGSITSRNTRRLFSTSEMSFNFVRTATVESGPLKAEGRFTGLTGRLALATATITDARDDVVAHMTCRNVMADTPETADPPPAGREEVAAIVEALPTPDRPEYPIPDPYLRPVVGEVLERAAWEGATGLDVLQGQIDGSVPMPPIHHLTGLRPTAVGEGTAEFAMPASKWLTSGFQSVLGGFLALLGYSALGSAIQTTTEPGMAHVPVDLKVNFLRPVFADPEVRDLTAKGHVVHRGRTLSVADSLVYGVDGKTVAVARGTSMFLPDQPASAG